MKTSTDTISQIQFQLTSSLIPTSSATRSDESWARIFSMMISSADQIEHLYAAPSSALATGDVGDRANGYFVAGRNMALPDPESAYKMMTDINNKDVTYKAQFSELSQVKSSVAQMRDAGGSLGSIALSSGNDRIQAGLQDFVAQYNIWIRHINPDLQSGGLLADTQAAQATRFELEQNFSNPFFGAGDGVHGLRDLGVTIDPDTRLASLDPVRLDEMLTNNKQGVVDAVQEFSANFARSARLLNSDGNFILKQLGNLNRAIHYISDNQASLQAEFGTGNPARPTGHLAEALAVYNQSYAA
ncbi:MAG: hypothetical protein HY016_10860 [Nitrosomonadales bacterium]|nr:hypothetical protein [Nitrosomonadales bacterium]